MNTLPQIAFDFAADKNARQNGPAEMPSPAQALPNEQTAGVGVRLKHTKNNMERKELQGTEMKRAEAASNSPETASGQPVIEATFMEIPSLEKIPPEEKTAAEKTAAEKEASTEEEALMEEGALMEVPAGKAGKSTRGRKSLKQITAEADLIEIPGDEELFSKQYYTMGEVAAMFKVNQSLLRFWEAEFNILQPRKNKKGDRYFRPADIKNLHLIYHLLRQRKYTIEGAKEFLKNSKKAEAKFEAIRRLQDIRAFLLELKAQI